MNNIKDQANFFCDLNKQINSIYEEYAKSVGLSYTSLYTLHMIALTRDCTQKYIAEQMFLPKQTINSVISAFHKQGLIELREKAEDKRHKTLHLTPKGQQFAKQIFPQIEAAEQNSIAQFSEEERSEFLKLMKKYVDFFSHEMKRWISPTAMWEKKIPI